MQTFNLIISKTTIATMMEALVWKYANAVDNDGNPKGVRNIKSDRVDDALDSLIVSGAWAKRTNEVVSMVREFAGTVSGTDTITIAMTMPTRWNGKQATLQSHVDKYILDGLMVDWFNVTAPTEAAIYITKLQNDVTDITTELYTKGAPQ